jgi:hypothetical protein
MSQPPPPPPPHGEAPKSSGLPPGKYDIFVIPQHSAGSGFLYLPSLQPSINSFAAGFASALILVAMFQSMAPAFQAWWSSFNGMGNMGMTMLMVAIGVGAWAFGRTQQETPPQPTFGSSGGSSHGPPPGYSGQDSGSNTAPPPPPPPHNGAPPPQPPPPNGGTGGPGTERPKPSWSRPPPGTTRTETPPPKGSWEKAREETRKREEERKAKEEEQRRRDETARKLRELREREAREREQREKEARERKEKIEKERMERERVERDLREKLDRERQEREKLQKEKAEHDRVERLERERLERLDRERLERERVQRREQERKEREAREAAEKLKREEEEANAARKASTYAFSGVGEKINPWPNGKPKPTATATSPPPTPSNAAPPKCAPSETSYASSNADKRPPPPTARTFTGSEEDMYSYRPYDKPKAPRRRRNSQSSLSEMSWAPSHTTARTTPPPSARGPYVSKDPDKIVIKAVYMFMNQFAKTPASQLMSGVGPVTDGLVLKINSAGLFIDDDLRNVGLREWDVKAWTLKQVEVWCPPHCLTPSPKTPGATKEHSSPNVLHKLSGQRLRERGATKLFSGDEGDAYLTELPSACKNGCGMGLCDAAFKNTNIPSPAGQTGTWRNKGLHLLRATVRDQEGKRYLFVVDEAEAWKVAVGLQRLRGGTQVRALGVSGIGASEVVGILETLGW